MPKSIQATISAADEMFNEYELYRQVQVEYFKDQTQVKLDKLRDQGRALDYAARNYKKERDAK